MSDDAEAIRILNRIAVLAKTLYPVADGSDIDPKRFFALGYIAGLASAALEDPPRCPPFEEGFRK